MQYPLFVRTRDVVFGNGFVAEVSTFGRVVYDAAEEHWFYGVDPGGIAAAGDDLTSANVEYQRTTAGVLFDLAADAADYAEFASAVEVFFNDTNTFREREWREAVEVRDRNVTLGLPTTDAASTPFVLVRNKTAHLTASDNALPDAPLLAAAA